MLMSGFCSILHHFLAEQSVRKEIKPLQAKAIALYSADPMYGCQQNRIKPSSDLVPILEQICHTANNLTNCGIYLARQTFFNEKRIMGRLMCLMEL
jgi:hypothetical protein